MLKYPKWFHKQLSNKIILFRSKIDYEDVDIADFEINKLEEQLNVETLSSVIKVNYETIPIFDKINNPKAMGYTETTNHFLYCGNVEEAL